MKSKDSIFRIIRNCLGLSTIAMADKCGISAVYYSELERGIKINPSEEVLKKICNTCQLSLDSIYKLMRLENYNEIRQYLAKSLDNMAM